MYRKLISSLIILAFGAGVGLFVYKSEPNLNSNLAEERDFLQNRSFRLGLDLSGGSHLTYKADVSAVPSGEIDESMNALRDVIERRVNLFGVSEPVVQVQDSSFISGGENKLVVDLPGETDLEKATKMIGETPLLEFKIEAPKDAPQNVSIDENGKATLKLPEQFVSTELTGRYLEKATLIFDENTREPRVSLQFDETGTKLFAEITKANVGKLVAIYLDGAPISVPVVNEEIPNGEAIISGSFNPVEARQLVGRLNSGALPVPISLLSKQTIGATLGGKAVEAGIKAGIIGFLAIAFFLIFWYRLPGLLATIALCIFVLIVLSIFKLMPVTLTAAGIAGFIISVGIAVDANVLIFERLREELKLGHSIREAVSAGFARAWSSIRDSNISTLITATILFWFGTSLIKGFALTLGIGVLVSLFSSLIATRVFLSALSFMGERKITRFLFSSGLSK